MKHNHENWTLVNKAGRLNAGKLIAQVDLAHPNLGLQAVQLDGWPQGNRQLALIPSNNPVPSDNPNSWPAQLADSYIRGRDLVATYAGVEAWPYSPTIYWSADPLDAGGEILASLSLVVSIQTNLLDTFPRIDVRSTLNAEEVLLISVVDDNLVVDSHGDGAQSIDPHASACGMIWRLPGETHSYAELMPTTDFRQLSIDRAAGAIGSRWELFAEFLEKGVIRRARLQSLFLPRENDVQLAAESCQAIERRPLPLTT